jgi:hypothetical protein
MRSLLSRAEVKCDIGNVCVGGGGELVFVF